MSGGRNWRLAVVASVENADRLVEMELYQPSTPRGRPKCVVCGKGVPPRARMYQERPLFCTDAHAARFGRWAAEQMFVTAANPDYVPPRPRDG